jgi:hypothetical protein
VPEDDVEGVVAVVAVVGVVVVLVAPGAEAWAASVAKTATMSAAPPAISRLIRDMRRTAASRIVAAARARRRSGCSCKLMAPGCGRRLMPR